MQGTFDRYPAAPTSAGAAGWCWGWPPAVVPHAATWSIPWPIAPAIDHVATRDSAGPAQVARVAGAVVRATAGSGLVVVDVVVENFPAPYQVPLCVSQLRLVARIGPVLRNGGDDVINDCVGIGTRQEELVCHSPAES